LEVGRSTAVVRTIPSPPLAIADITLGSKKVLKPAEFQEFELEEKTVLSHNTAMYASLICREQCS
jgi:hypothetical protein